MAYNVLIINNDLPYEGYAMLKAYKTIKSYLAKGFNSQLSEHSIRIFTKAIRATMLRDLPWFTS